MSTQMHLKLAELGTTKFDGDEFSTFSVAYELAKRHVLFLCHIMQSVSSVCVVLPSSVCSRMSSSELRRSRSSR